MVAQATTTPPAQPPAPMPSATGSMGGGRPILTPDYLLAHRVGIPGQKDVIWNPLYDFQAYPSAGVPGNALSFFSNQQGQGTSSAPGVGAAVPKTVFDTNIQAPNQLTLGNEFYAIGSETLFYPGVSVNTTTPFAIEIGRTNISTTIGLFADDVWAVMNQGFKSLKVGTDRYYIQDGPLALFPPATRLAMVAALSGAGATTTVGQEVVYAAASGEPYTLVPIYIQTNQLFTMVYSFPTQIALPSTQIARIGERLRGYLVRQAT